VNEIKVGIIVGESTTTEFTFACDPKGFPTQWEYLLINSQELIKGQLQPIQILAQNMHNVSESPTLTEDLDLQALERLKKHDLGDVKVYGTARILGFFSLLDKDKKQVLMPRRPLTPGMDVLLAPSAFLKDFFQVPKEEALYLGELISRPDVSVSVSVNGLRRHLAILAQTGGGKSYTTGVLMEELYELGATIIVIDPHADYVLLNRDEKGQSRNKNIVIYRNPNSTSRFTTAEMGNVQPFTVKFGKLDPSDVAELAGIKKSDNNQLALIEESVKYLRNNAGVENNNPYDDIPDTIDVNFTPQDMLDVLQQIHDTPNAPEWADIPPEAKKTASRVMSKVRRFTRRRVFGNTRVPLNNFLQDQKISVIDLSGLEQEDQDYIAYRLLTDLYDHCSGQPDPKPVFIFIEEAHNFVPEPGKKRTRSSRSINKISSEGRKFGMFLVLITQRPKKIDPDSLSQCNSQIILRITNPKDQTAIQDSAERVSQDLLDDLPGLNVGDAILVGQITKIPILAHIRPRKTKEGGRDIDVVTKLKKARQNASDQANTISPTDRDERERERNPF